MAKRPNPELVRYIEHHLAKGFHIKDIKRKLAEVGHPIEAIEDAAVFVTSKEPKRKMPRFMIVYGVILLVVVIVFLYFVWFKATQQVEYKAAVQEIEKNQSYLGKTDVDLLKMAAAGDDLEPCSFIQSHNIKYACLGSYWRSNICYYRQVIGEPTDGCRLMQRFGESLFSKYCSPYKTYDGCLAAVSIGEKDVSYCGNYSPCVENFYLSPGTPEACEKLSRGAKNACILDLAIARNDKSLCDRYDSSFNSCILHFLDDAAIADYYNSIYAKMGEGVSEQDVLDFVDEYDEKFENEQCSRMEGSFKGVALKDYCLLHRVQTGVFYTASSFASANGAGLCSQITAPEIRECCSSAVSERFIRAGCSFWYG